MSRSIVNFCNQDFLNHISSNSTTVSYNLCTLELLISQGLTHTPLISDAGLQAFDVIRKTKCYSKMVEVDEIIAELRVAASHVNSNFMNKVELLEAEKCGIHYKHYEALTSYEAAIESARKNKFTHEQGLACEKAGFYCKSMNDNEKASTYFNQARECYEKWGSSMKLEFVQRELHKLQ